MFSWTGYYSTFIKWGNFSKNFNLANWRFNPANTKNYWDPFRQIKCSPKVPPSSMVMHTFCNSATSSLLPTSNNYNFQPVGNHNANWVFFCCGAWCIYVVIAGLHSSSPSFVLFLSSPTALQYRRGEPAFPCLWSVSALFILTFCLFSLPLGNR